MWSRPSHLNLCARSRADCASCSVPSCGVGLDHRKMSTPPGWWPRLHVNPPRGFRAFVCFPILQSIKRFLWTAGGPEASVNHNHGEGFTPMSPLSAQVQLINDAYNLLIDAMLGPEADCSNIKEPYSGILVTLKQVNIPIVSVDVPSGKRTPYDGRASRRLPPCCRVRVFRWRGNPRLGPARREPVILRIRYLPSEISHLRPHASVSFPVFRRLGRGRAEPGRDQPRCSYLAHGSKKVRHEFLREAFLGWALPAL